MLIRAVTNEDMDPMWDTLGSGRQLASSSGACEKNATLIQANSGVALELLRGDQEYTN